MAFISGEFNNDFLEGTQESDFIQGRSGNDTLRGLGGSDEVNGNEGADLINGNQGNDTLHGGKGNDLVFGGQDQDVIWGDRGIDSLTGGLGNDVFVLDNRDTGSFTIADADCIIDFNNGDPTSAGGGFGRDILGLTEGLTFDDVFIFDGSGDNTGDTVIQDKLTGRYLGVIKGIDRTAFNNEDFTTSLIPIFAASSTTAAGGTVVSSGLISPAPGITPPSSNDGSDDGGGDGGDGGDGDLFIPNPGGTTTIFVPLPPGIPPSLPPALPSAIRVLNPDGTLKIDNLPTIQDAVDAAADNDIIRVGPGSYAGATINKAVKLIGPNFNSSPLPGGTRQNEAVILSPLRVSVANIQILGFEFNDQGLGGFNGFGASAPIFASPLGSDVDNLVVQSNKFVNIPNIAIFLNALDSPVVLDNVKIVNNFIDGTSLFPTTGIILWDSTNSVISNNRVQDFWGGINVEQGVNTDIDHNRIVNTLEFGIQAAGTQNDLLITANRITDANTSAINDVGGIVLFSSFDSTASLPASNISGNTIDGTTLNGLSIQVGTTIPANTLFVYENNFIHASGVGILNNSTNSINADNSPGLGSGFGNFFTIVPETGGTNAALVDILNPPNAPSPIQVAIQPSF